MAKVAVIIAPGFEEGEGLALVDVFRRAEIACDMVGLESAEVAGGHEIVVRTDVVFDGSLDDYDMVVLPGGYGGADAMRADDRFQDACQFISEEYGDDGRRRLVRAETVVVSGCRRGYTQQILIFVHRAYHGAEKQQKLRVLIGCVSRREQPYAVVRRKRPVVVLA